jgi:hypothetical protein
MSALSQRLAKLEGPRILAAHRPEGLTSDEFLSLIVRTVAAVPILSSVGVGRVAVDAAIEAAAGPWLRAMTPEEAKDLLDGIIAVEKLHQAAAPDGTPLIRRA